MTCSVYIGASIDGFIAARDGGLQWLEGYANPSGTDYGYAEFVKQIAAIVTGRATYEEVLTFADCPYKVPAYALSSAHTTGARVRFIDGGVQDAVRAATDAGRLRLYVDGRRTIRLLLEEDLIEELLSQRYQLSWEAAFGSLE